MADTVTVNVTQGNLRGKKVTTKSGLTYYSFQGIPYAKPPVGPLRFKAPEPAEPWTGTRDAFKCGASAPQDEKMIHNKYIGEEDCLFLNVYSTQLPLQSGEKKKPVMVFIHGGAFLMGSGNDDIYQPDHLMTGNIILVTLNYRLGALGFLYTEDSETTGNNGLRDQAMALRWVQQNIEQFGGDSGNVTIFGESAGGASVHAHMVSPISKGLFHKAIAQSGCMYTPWSCTQDPREKAFRLGAVLGCKSTNSKELVEFLRTVPAQELTEAIDKAVTDAEKASFVLFFSPCVEKENQNEVFLPAHPIQLLAEGKFHKVPFMLGFTSHEGMIVLKGFNENPATLKALASNEESVIPITRKLKRNTDESKQIARKIKNFYFGDKPVGEESLPELINLYGDVFFNHGIIKTAEEQAKQSDTPVYMYQFSFDEDNGIVETLLGTKKMPGVCHAAELPYLFKGFFIQDNLLKPDTEHMKVVNKMVKLWTNFAKTGNPTPNGEKDIGVKWNPVTSSKRFCLDINLTPSLRTDIMKDRYAFWDEIQAQL